MTAGAATLVGMAAWFWLNRTRSGRVEAWVKLLKLSGSDGSAWIQLLLSLLLLVALGCPRLTVQLFQALRLRRNAVVVMPPHRRSRSAVFVTLCSLYTLFRLLNHNSTGATDASVATKASSMSLVTA